MSIEAERRAHRRQMILRMGERARGSAMQPMTLLGVPLEEMDRDELLATAAFLHDQYATGAGPLSHVRQNFVAQSSREPS